MVYVCVFVSSSNQISIEESIAKTREPFLQWCIRKGGEVTNRISAICWAFTVNLISFIFSHYFIPVLLTGRDHESWEILQIAAVEPVSYDIFIRNDEKKSVFFAFVCLQRLVVVVIAFVVVASFYLWQKRSIINLRSTTDRTAHEWTNKNRKNYILLLRDINAGWFCVHVLKITR